MTSGDKKDGEPTQSGGAGSGSSPNSGSGAGPKETPRAAPGLARTPDDAGELGAAGQGASKGATGGGAADAGPRAAPGLKDTAADAGDVARPGGPTGESGKVGAAAGAAGGEGTKTLGASGETPKPGGEAQKAGGGGSAAAAAAAGSSGSASDGGKAQGGAGGASGGATRPAGGGGTKQPPPSKPAQRSGGGSGFAGKLLIALILLLVGAGVALWAAPRVSPYLPEQVARYLSTAEPGVSPAALQEAVDRIENRLAEISQAATEARATADEARTAAGEAGAAPDEALAERVAELENAISGVAAEVASTTVEATARQDAIENLRERVDEIAAAGAAPEGLSELRSRVDELSNQLASLRESVAAGGATGEGDAAATSALRNTLSEQREQLSSLEERVASINDQIEQLSERVGDLADRMEETPASEAGADPERVAQIADQLDQLAQTQDRIASTQDELSSTVETLAADMETVRGAQATEAEARVRTEAAVEEMRQSARLTAALNEIERALTLGRPFEDALSDVRETVDAETPEAIERAAGGDIPSREALKASFPDAAHAAIEAALAAEATEGQDAGWLSGVAARIEARFTGLPDEPIAGDSAQAKLSRARAALLDGDLDGAIDVIETLPEAARQAMDGWLEDARLRSEADAALLDWRAEIGRPS